MRPFDIEQARAETPGVAEGVFLDSAGSSLMPAPVTEAVIDHLQLESHLGGYRAKDERDRKIEDVYNAVARLLNCDRDEVALLENATRAWDAVFYALRFDPGDRVLIDTSAYGSNYLAFLQVARHTGIEIEVVPDNEEGELDVDALEGTIDERTRLIALTWIPTASGRVNPAAAVGTVARAHDVLYLLDGCQAVGQLPVDVAALGCDFFSGTGRKYLRGPRGTGFLYIRDALVEKLEPGVIDVRSAEWTAPDAYRLQPNARRFETWEMNYAALLGLGTAITYALDWNIDHTWQRIRSLADQLRARLNQIPGVATHDAGQTRCGIVTFSIDGLAAQEIKEELAARDFTVYVLRAASQRLDFELRGLTEVVRASLHYFNTEDELERFAETVESLTENELG